MAIGNPVPVTPAHALGPHPRHPYSADIFPSNWQLWRNFPDATQQWRDLWRSRARGPLPRELLPQLLVGEARNITVSWHLWLARYFERGPGVGLMMVVMLVAGIGCLLAGLLAIGLGIPVKEFSFGNTLILAGAMAACTGLVILGLWVVVRELKNIAVRLGPGASSDWAETAMQPTAAAPPRRHQAPEGGGFLFSRDQPREDAEAEAHPSAPWRDDGSARSALPEPAETAPAAKPRRNLMFSSKSRRERERAQAEAADVSADELGLAPAAMPPALEIDEAPPATFENAWPKSDRSRSTEAHGLRRSGRSPSTFSEATPDDTAGAVRHPLAEPPVTVLKSGVVDGMAYSLYSDGSIEAQMPEGMMRFASIDELRAHLDQRP
jgi:hypothetical protein